jgi:hypothetical protein
MDAPKPNVSLSLKTHRRQLFWQILIPLLVVALLLVVVAVLVAVGSTGSVDTRAWADVSTIWLLAPMLILALLVTILLGFIIYGLAKLMQVTPRLTGKAQDFFSLLAEWVRKITDILTKPVFWARQAGAILNSVFKP